MFITYLLIDDDVSLEGVENVGKTLVTLGKKHHLWVAGDSLPPVKLILSPEEEF